jgi:GH35 family endo-1,4-beta-xylanase
MTVHLISLVIALMCAGSAYASPAPPARCEKIKLSAASTVADHLFRCFAKAVGTGHAVDNACLTAANARLAKAFTTAEARLICSFTGESTVVGARVTALAGNLAGAMGTGPSACDRKKLLAAGERAWRTLAAQARHALAPELDKLGAALDDIALRFAAGIAIAESTGHCTTAGDATTIAQQLDTGIADVVDAVRGTLATLGAQRGRLIGTAVRANVLAVDSEYRETVLRHFNYVTAEYEFMWGNIEPTPGNYMFGPVDTTAAFAEQHGLPLKGAPLVWHLILPPWVNDGMTAADLQSAVDQRIDTLVGRYVGKVATWDVVNEAMPDGTGGYRNSIFLQKLGPDYIRNAFVRARQADPNALLFYNDFLAEGINEKSDFIYGMIQTLLAQGTPIDGVGFQMHLGGTFGPIPTTASVVQNLQRFADLGLRVRISEMDVQKNFFDGKRADQLALQRKVYHDMVAACLAVAGCESVTFWGFTDRYTWVNDYLGFGDAPLPFDFRYRQKAAFFGVRDALLGF